MNCKTFDYNACFAHKLRRTVPNFVDAIVTLSENLVLRESAANDNLFKRLFS